MGKGTRQAKAMGAGCLIERQGLGAGVLFRGVWGKGQARPKRASPVCGKL